MRSARQVAGMLSVALLLVTCFSINTSAAHIRREVGEQLQQALNLAKTGDYVGAISKVRDAEAVPRQSPEESKTIKLTREYIEVKAGGNVGVSSATAAQAKIDSDYSEHRYASVVADVPLLEKFGKYNMFNHVLVAQSYFKLGNIAEAKHQAELTIAWATSTRQRVPPEIASIAKLRTNAQARTSQVERHRERNASNTSIPEVSGQLTNDRAEQAILAFFGPGRFTRLDVIGVQEFPQENSARADLYMTGFTYNAPQNDAVTAYVFGPGGGQQVYTGKASAIFAHYNDGRWVLVKVVTPMGNFEAN